MTARTSAPHPRIENYLEVARRYRGTDASAAILGLISWVEGLENLKIELSETLRWCAERGTVDGGMTDVEQRVTWDRVNRALGELP